MKERAVRLRPRQFRTMCEALRHHGMMLRERGDREALRTLTMMVRGLPTCAPYEVRISEREWPVVSRALRPQGSNPTPGSTEAKWYSLYQTFIQPHYFGGLRVLSERTQREHRQRMEAIARRRLIHD